MGAVNTNKIARYPAANPQFAIVAVVQKIIILRFLAAS